MSLQEVVDKQIITKKAFDEALKPLADFNNGLRRFLLAHDNGDEDRFLANHIAYIFITPPTEGVNYWSIHSFVYDDKFSPPQYTERVKLKKDVYFPKIATKDIEDSDFQVKLREDFRKKFKEAWDSRER